MRQLVDRLAHMRRCFLHIGTYKTGTASISTVADPRPSLLSKAVFTSLIQANGRPMACGNSISAAKGDVAGHIDQVRCVELLLMSTQN